jgi:hypothetical protein
MELMETVFLWLYLVAIGCALIFACLMVQDLWRQQSKQKSESKPLRVSSCVKRRMPALRRYDSPELYLKDTVLRDALNEKAQQAKADR